MSTKNLARTVIEGGRTGCSRWNRRHSNAEHRVREHRVSARLSRGAIDFEGAVYPRRRPVWREFDDKLGPAQRWLASQVGRPWSKARSELFARFDVRTTAGRHIVFDHLLPEVEGRFTRKKYVVDHVGILRKVKRS